MRFGILVLVVVIAMGFIFWRDVQSVFRADRSSELMESSKEKKTSKDNEETDVEVGQKWELPEILKEVSGIAYLDESRFATVQDELGKVFIFNIRENKIEREILFGDAGDYEGITVKGDIVYVVRADGTLFEVNMRTGSKANEYKTHLTAKNNVEGLTYDKNNDRLLLAEKDGASGNKEFKNIYPFDLKTGSLSDSPVYSIDPSHNIVEGNGKKKGTIMPSAIAVHPTSGEIYITDGPNSRLLILNKDGIPNRFIDLGKEFAQPEGITFSPQGDLYISNEGSKDPGNIILVRLK